MITKDLSNREKELIKRGLEAEARERAELIDNMVRARILPPFVEPKEKTEELKKMYRQKLDSLGYQ